MARNYRAVYPDKVRYVTGRFDAGAVQKATGVPASLISRLHNGTCKSLSVETVAKLERAYNNYWDKRMEAGGLNPDERRSILRTNTPPSFIRERIAENRELARMIRDNRIARDMNRPGFKRSWHTIKDILKNQMALDTTRTAQEWAWIAEHGSG